MLTNNPMTFPNVDSTECSSWPAPTISRPKDDNENNATVTIGPSKTAWLPDDVVAKNNLTIVGPGILAVGQGLTDKNNLTIEGAVTLIIMGDLIGKIIIDEDRWQHHSRGHAHRRPEH